MSSDKAYSAELRLNQLWNHLGPAPAGTGNGQRVTVYTTADQLINSTTDGVIAPPTGPALSYTVAAASYPAAYLISGKFIATQGSSAGGNQTQAVGFTGPATSHVRISACWFASGGSAYPTGAVVISSLSGGVSTPAFSLTTQNYWDFEGLLVFTAGGALSMVGHCNGVFTWTANSYSFMTLESVGQTS